MSLENEDIIVCENLVKIYKIAEIEVFALQGLELRVKKKGRWSVSSEAAAAGNPPFSISLEALIPLQEARSGWLDGISTK